MVTNRIIRVAGIACALQALLCSGQGAYAAEASPTAAEPTRIVIECEDMQGVNQTKFGPAPTWQVGRWGKDLYQNMVFGGVWASRLRVAMADATATPSEVSSAIDVPADGTYKVWAKYECPPNFNYAFGLRIDPVGGTAISGKSVFDKTYGLIGAEKHYSFNDAPMRESLYWSWGMDHDAAEGYTVKLRKGRYRVTLYKTANPQPAGARSVDAILITSEISPVSAPKFPRYPLLDELRRANHVYFRFRNKTAEPVKISWNHWGHRPPDYYNAAYRELVRYYDAAGKPLSAPANNNGDWPEPISPHGTSVWYDLGPTMNTESTSPFVAKATLPDSKGLTESGPSLPFGMDIALAPDSGKILKSFELEAPETELNVLIQPDLMRKEGLENTKKISDVYTDFTKWLNAEPRIGPVPKQMKLFAGTGGVHYSGASYPNGQQWDFEINQAYRSALGLNTLPLMDWSETTKSYVDEIVKWSADKGGVIPRSLGYIYSQDAAEVTAKVKSTGLSDNFYYVSYGDEIGLPNIDVNDTAKVEAFRAFVKAEGETPQTLGVASWEQVKPLQSLSADVAVQIGVLPQNSPKGDAGITKLKRLYWYSIRYRDHEGIAKYAAVTKQLKAELGAGVQTTENMGSMHPFYWMNQSTFIDALKDGAMSLAWSEDYTYCQPEGSRLVADFEVSYMRKGASYNDTPMMFYCMPHYPGNTPQHLLQNAVMLWGNNVKDIDWFSVSPDAWSTENHVAYPDGLPILKTIRTVSGMAGLIENDLIPARPVQTPVAMLLSESSDIWEVEGKSQGDIAPGTVATNVSQEERKALWYALRLAGYRVDFVTEDDLKEGLLKNYKVVYVSGQNLERKAAAALKEWVRTGGVVMATAGAARKDEADEPLTVLDEVFGRGAQKSYERYQGPLRAKLELLFEKPKDQIQLGASTLKVLCSEEKFVVPATVQVLGKYKSDGSPAIIKNRFGNGTAYYTGALPGQSFLQHGLPVVPMGKGGSESNMSHFEPVDFDPVARNVILRALAENKIAPDTRAAHRSVVCSRLAGPASTVVPIVNLAEGHDGQLKNLEVRLSGLEKAPSKVWTAFHKGSVPFRREGADWVITLPTLQSADVIVLSY